MEPAPKRRISVVLPVYDEQDSIAACLRGLARALDGHEHEILVCHDSDEDKTLPAIAAMPDRPASVVLVRNRLGPGAANALRAGFAAASGDVVVTTMADLSDPPEVIVRMAEAIRSGADVVSGSRYMPGGSQSGGPRLKRTLSRIAGVSLAWIAGMRTRDATSNFRGYSRTFLDRVAIESRRGFEIALELTVKAHLSGARVSEVPSSWVDRSAGTSRFRLWRWMPNYLRWYLRAMAAPLLVGAVWVLMVAGAHHYLSAYADPVPFQDDYSLVGALTGDTPISPGWLWAQHNEHRIPLPLLVGVGLLEWTHDFRAAMHAQVVLLAVVSLGMILAARKIRGRTSVTDAFFAFLYLHWGHYGNIAWAFQIALVLPAALASVVLMLVAADAPARRTALGIGVCSILLPLCGAAGLLQVPPIAVWLGLAGLGAWRSRDPARSRAAPVLIAVAVAALGVFAFYFVGYRAPDRPAGHADLAQTLVSALRMLAMGIGPAGLAFWPITGLLLSALGLFTLALLVATWRHRPNERWRAAGMVACGLGAVALALGIGWGRGLEGRSGAALRYVTLATPFLALLYLAWCRYGSRRGGRVVQAALCLGLGALVPTYVRPAVRYAEERAHASDLLVRDVEAGLEPEELAERHWGSFFISEEGFAIHLDGLRKKGLPPFHDPAGEPSPAVALERLFYFWKPRPIDARSDRPITRRRIAGSRAIVIHAPGEIVLGIPPGARAARGGFGVDPRAYQFPRRSTDGIRFTVEHAGDSAEVEVLFERILDPATEPRDGKLHEFAVELPPEAGRKLVLRVSNASVDLRDLDWGFWTGVEFD